MYNTLIRTSIHMQSSSAYLIRNPGPPDNLRINQTTDIKIRWITKRINLHRNYPKLNHRKLPPARVDIDVFLRSLSRYPNVYSNLCENPPYFFSSYFLISSLYTHLQTSTWTQITQSYQTTAAYSIISPLCLLSIITPVKVSRRGARKFAKLHVANGHYILMRWIRWYCSEYILWSRHYTNMWHGGK